jgi:undecaprenyl-diphosphatase
LSYLESVILGVIQGFTEWLPISSTAHLRVAPALFHWQDPGAAFDAVIQLGTFLAALVYFRHDIMAILTGHPSDATPGSRTDRRLLVPILVGTLPVVIVGFAMRHWIETSARSLWVVSGSMVGFALLLAIAEMRRSVPRGIETVTVTDGLIVGLGQMLALCPGASRSGTTITAALFSGMERAAAARFSFLLSLPAVGAAGIFEPWKTRHAFTDHAMLGPIIVATFVSFVVGIATIHWLMNFLRTRSTWIFIGYRLVVGAIILAALASGILSASAGQ